MEEIEAGLDSWRIKKMVSRTHADPTGDCALSGHIADSPQPTTETDLGRRLAIRLATASRAELEAFVQGGAESAAVEERATLLTVTAAAALVKLSRSTLYRLMRDGQLSRVEIRPGMFRVRLSEMLRLSAQGIVAAPASRGVAEERISTPGRAPVRRPV